MYLNNFRGQLCKIVSISLEFFSVVVSAIFHYSGSDKNTVKVCDIKMPNVPDTLKFLSPQHLSLVSRVEKATWAFAAEESRGKTGFMGNRLSYFKLCFCFFRWTNPMHWKYCIKMHEKYTFYHYLTDGLYSMPGVQKQRTVHCFLPKASKSTTIVMFCLT